MEIKFVDESKIDSDNTERLLLLGNPDKGPKPMQKGFVNSKKQLVTYEVKKVLGMSCPNKFLITINGETVCFVNSNKGAKPIIDYAYSNDPIVLQNGKIRKRIDDILKSI